MRLWKLMLSLAVICSSATTVLGANVTREQALKLTQDQFKDLEVDYYLLDNNDDHNWTIFVDAAPLCGWAHDCYTITVPKQVETNGTCPSFIKTYLTLPPQGSYIPLEIKSRRSLATISDSQLEVVTEDSTPNPYSDDTYALIISGGISPLANYKRYWNDCAFIYQVLTKQYHIPKTHIYPLMADGNDPAVDSFDIQGKKSLSQSLDLDLDGEPEIELAATKQNIENTIDHIKVNINSNQHLFIFVIDHGNTYTESGKSGSLINLWNYETLKDYELVNLLKPLTDAKVNVNLVLGQCYSGGFVEPLANIGCVVATACADNEPSWASFSKSYEYDEFVYHWTKGIQKNGLYYTADNNTDGQVSMLECFDYASANDLAEESPQYGCKHKYLGEDLAFNYIPPSVNLYIPDNDKDVAKEPNSSTEIFWESPSIIVTTGATSGNPSDMTDDYPGTSGFREIYVNVTNRGKEDYSQGKKVCLYWTKAGIGTNPAQWLGADNDGSGPVGGLIGQTVIADIPAGSSRLVKFNWQLPSYLKTQNKGIQSIDYLATIVDATSTAPGFSGTNIVKVLQNKNFAQKGISKFSKSNYSKTINMDSYLPDPRVTYSLEIRPKNTTAAKILNQNCLAVQMNGKTYTSMSDKYSGNSDELDSRNIYMSIPAVTQGSFSLNFTPAVFEAQDVSAQFLLFLKDEKGNTVAGHSLVMTTPEAGGVIELQASYIEPGVYEIGVTDPMWNNCVWTNQRGEEISNDSSLVVVQAANAQTFNVRAIDENGDMGYGEITIDEANLIKSVVLSGNEVSVTFNPLALTGDRLSLSSLFDTNVLYNLSVEEATERISIPTISLTPGFYILSYTTRAGINEVVKFELK